MTQLRFSHMALSCKDPLAIEQFYTRYFGFVRARVVMPGLDQVVFLKKDTVYLELFRAKQEAAVATPEGAGPEYPGWRHIAFQVEDVAAVLAEMGDAAQITLGPLDFGSVIPGWRTVWIADPDGNIVEISQGYVDQEGLPLS